MTDELKVDPREGMDFHGVVDSDAIVDESLFDKHDMPVTYDLPGGPGEYEFTYHHQRYSTPGT